MAPKARLLVRQAPPKARLLVRQAPPKARVPVRQAPPKARLSVQQAPAKAPQSQNISLDNKIDNLSAKAKGGQNHLGGERPRRSPAC